MKRTARELVITRREAALLDALSNAVPSAKLRIEELQQEISQLKERIDTFEWNETNFRQHMREIGMALGLDDEPGAYESHMANIGKIKDAIRQLRESK
jgi:predicted  nucleic acid-binding Zn-ribbon protein